MYNNKSLFVDNQINRYSIGKYTEGLKNNTDDSLDIYVQNANPGADKESNCYQLPREYSIWFYVCIYLTHKYSTEHGNCH
jgi:hypothetical protein